MEVYAQTTTSEGIILESFSRGVAITDFFMQGIGGQTRSGLRLDQGFFSAVIDQVEVRDMFRGVFVQGNVFGADATISNVFVSSTINQARGVEIYDINGLTVSGNNSIETSSGTIMILAGNVIAPGNVTFGQVLGAMAVNFG